MKKISSENVEDGMVLAREVQSLSGSVLVNKGTVLTAALGRRLTNWGIPSVFIEGDEDVLSEEISPAVQQEELKASLMNKFSNCISNPLMKKLFVTVYNYRIIGKNQ